MRSEEIGPSSFLGIAGVEGRVTVREQVIATRHVSCCRQVALPTQCNVVDVVCGTDFTFVLTGYGRLMAFGNNEDNQMGLNTPRGLRKRLASVSTR